MGRGIWALCLDLACPVPHWLQLLERRSLPSRLPPPPSPEKAADPSFCLSRLCQCLLPGARSMTAPESRTEQRPELKRPRGGTPADAQCSEARGSESRKARLFCRVGGFTHRPPPASRPHRSPLYPRSARRCQELLSSVLHRGLGMKGLTGVSLPVARHGGIVSKLLNHGSRALPARGQEERGQRPEGVGPPCGPQRAHASPGARRPGRGPALQHRLGRSLPDLGRENSPRPFPSSQSEWASGSTVGVNPASHTAPRAQPHPHGAHSIFSPSSPSLSTANPEPSRPTSAPTSALSGMDTQSPALTPSHSPVLSVEHFP